MGPPFSRLGCGLVTDAGAGHRRALRQRCGSQRAAPYARRGRDWAASCTTCLCGHLTGSGGEIARLAIIDQVAIAGAAIAIVGIQPLATLLFRRICNARRVRDWAAPCTTCLRGHLTGSGGEVARLTVMD